MLISIKIVRLFKMQVFYMTLIRSRCLLNEQTCLFTRWCRYIETLFAILALCEWNLLATFKFLSQNATNAEPWYFRCCYLESIVEQSMELLVTVKNIIYFSSGWLSLVCALTASLLWGTLQMPVVWDCLKLSAWLIPAMIYSTLFSRW